MAVLLSMKIASAEVLRNTHSPEGGPMLLEIHFLQDPTAVRGLVHE